MATDEPTSPNLGPEEVGARVSAILEAAERDARAVIAAAYHEAAAAPEPAAPATLEELARALDELRGRVEALERASGAAPRSAGPEEAAAAPPASEPTVPQREDAARVRATELALAGYSRVAIARELAGAMAPADVDRLLGEVLAG